MICSMLPSAIERIGLLGKMLISVSARPGGSLPTNSRSVGSSSPSPGRTMPATETATVIAIAVVVR